MKTEYENNSLTIKLGSEINTANAAAVKDEIDDLVAKYNVAEIIFDAKELGYISSAGLRIFWQLHQTSHINFYLTNVIPQVYNIFALTRLNDIIDIRRAG